MLAGFAPDELLALGGGRPVWVAVDGAAPPELDRTRAVLQLAPAVDPLAGA